MLPSTAQLSDSEATVHAQRTRTNNKYNNCLFFSPEMTLCCKQSSNEARRKKYNKLDDLFIACQCEVLSLWVMHAACRTYGQTID